MSQHLGIQAMVLREATYDDIPTLVTLIRTAFEEYRGRLEAAFWGASGNGTEYQ